MSVLEQVVDALVIDLHEVDPHGPLLLVRALPVFQAHEHLLQHTRHCRFNTCECVCEDCAYNLFQCAGVPLETYANILLVYSCEAL